ncbi:lytic transglycosylase domain-containing protein [Desulfobulbus alkaliphilus]|uniref:lytic transglycosylase domain-containing protein n=1 Tax=Desulfobulbus alkaliphilus TaxID=869814 RepID=UPI0019637B68|nr:transglycosylase SLT domain-containing protein [Desulfobulbus alkaliphilus]MBM9537689.1 transglycosylase SLT domain-containing protein [Desulfobulbus alkaliphilus]
MKLPLSLTVLLLLVTALPVSAQAAMYAYVDERGIRHYTNVPGDGRHRVNLDPRPVRRPGDTEMQLIKTISKNPRNVSRPTATRQARSRLAPHTLNRYIQTAAVNHKVDPLLIKAVIKAESNFDPNAVSPKGAQGLMQLMPGTAKDLRVTNPFDPRQNINGGTKYLRYLLDNYHGNVELSLAAYNAGPGRVTPNGTIPRIPETINYVAKVMEFYRSYSDNGMPTPSSINVQQLVTIH